MSLLKRAVVCGGVLLALAACEHGDPVSTAGGERGHGILLSGTPSAATLPSGSAVVTTTFGGFTTGIQDAFGRKPTNATVARQTRFYRATNKYWRWRTSDGRNASAASLDPRTPVLQSTTAQIDPGYYAEMYPPDAVGADMYEFYGEFSGLIPNQQYELAFYHYRLTVNGQLDHSERILNGTVTQPDALGTVQGALARIDYDWVSNADCAANAPSFPVNANPFAIGTFIADATGYNYADKCWKANNGLAKRAETDQTKQIIGRSDDQTYNLPNYNYLELWEGSVGTGKRVMRVQLAQDLTPAGKPIANAYPAFPAPNTTGPSSDQGPVPAVDKAAAFPIDATLKASLPGAIGVPTNVVATLKNVQQLAAPVYKAWFINPTTGVAKEAAGRYVRTVGTTNVEDVASTTTFKGGPGTITFTAPYSTTTHGPYTDSLTFLVITKEDNAAATTPSISQPLWVKIFKIPPANAGGAFAFGNFNRDSLPTAGDTSRHPVVFTPQGQATGGVLGDTVTVMVQQTNGTLTRTTVFQGSRLEMKFTNLQRPPKGYEYLGYFRQKRDTTAATPTVVTRDSLLVYIGGLSGPAGESLSNADAAAKDGNLGPQTISVARLDVDAAPFSAGLCTFDKFRLYLVPKGGVASEPKTVIFDLALPEKVTKAASCR